ncbi:RNA polymerase sigma factor [Sphingobacterium bovistauri]|uniref:Sigma-70 family RNA polymerase sigma factor n=1 Tax=Sphingobacterium bovistauri TaxID=2781959 RepID=A0ABS7Z9A4_9SPHI|nr:sigma-70 family RNA polymerase sigma factor [Sphingobacterium bovistauri]MCA5006739.1 sigma-70 family RNA polymerase sigma factor [Sphingobacterium bovistauri]
MKILNYVVISDEDLYQLVSLQNDEAAFTELYNRYKGPLLAHAISKVDQINAEDIVHDLFIKLWQNRSNIKIKEIFAFYIFRALRNRIIDNMAHSIHINKYLDSMKDYSQQYNSNADYKLREELFLNSIDQLLNQYGPNAKSIVRLRLQGYNNSEIAEKLNLAEKTVRNQYSILVKHLKSKLIPLLILFFEIK